MNSYMTTVSSFTKHNLMLQLKLIYQNSTKPLPYLSNNYRQTETLHNGWTEFEVELARPDIKRKDNQKVQKQ